MRSWRGTTLALKRPSLIPVLAVAFVGPLFAQSPGLYDIDPRASRVEIHVFRGGLLGGLGDNHVIVLGRFTGTAEGAAEKRWEVRVLGESGSLTVTDPDASASTRREVEETMLGSSQLDVKQYPTIEVRSRSLVSGGTDKSWRMLADVTLHGVTRQVEFPLAWTQTSDRLRVWGKKELRLRDFNIQPRRLALGTIQVRNEFEMVYDITLQRRP